MPATSVVSRPRLRLIHAGGSLDLAPGTLLLGRDPGCDLAFDDPLASRHHARITTDSRGTTVVDLGSVNGTWVNGEPIHAARTLLARDRVVVGAQELDVVDARAPSRAERPGFATAPRAQAPAPPRGIVASVERAKEEPTGRTDAFELLAALADKAIAAGQGARAAELLGPYLRNIVGAARDGRPIAPDTSSFVARYAVKLGAALTDASWVDLAVELYTLLKVPLPSAVIDELSTQRPRLPLNSAALRRYVEVLRASGGRVDGERGAVQRIAALDALPKAGGR